MDLKKMMSSNIQIAAPANAAPSAKATVTFSDPTTSLEAAWADLRAEILGHPSLAGLTISAETVTASLLPARGLTATLQFRNPNAPAKPHQAPPRVAPGVPRGALAPSPASVAAAVAGTPVAPPAGPALGPLPTLAAAPSPTAPSPAAPSSPAPPAKS